MPIDEAVRLELLSMRRTAHAMTGTAYQNDASVRGDAGWAGKQTMLLADMALHLLQTSLGKGELSQQSRKKNLFPMLTIADQFVESQELNAVAGELYAR